LISQSRGLGDVYKRQPIFLMNFYLWARLKRARLIFIKNILT
jgi:hypothetical protein